MKIRFWGTRGSIAKAGPTTVRYGGNTSCVEIRSAADDVVILDAGTGIHGLGQEMTRESVVPRSASIFISHTHWDHIQGLPFFAPFFLPHHRWSIFGPSGVQKNLVDILRGQMSKAYFPITMQAFQAEINHHDLTEGHFQVGDISVTTQYLNHPGVTVGYRIEVDGVTVVYSTDHEPHARRLAAGGIPDKGSEDARHGQFLANADFVIHDAQYTAAEYDKRIGWGHSTMEYVVDLAARADVKHLVLFHHDPNRTDGELDQIVEAARSRVEGRPGKTEISAAAEGHDLYKQKSAPLSPVTSAALLVNPTEVQQHVEISIDNGSDDADIEPAPPSAFGGRKQHVPILLCAPTFPLLEEAVREAGQAVLVAPNENVARDLFLQHNPPVVFVEADNADQFSARWSVISGQAEGNPPDRAGILKILVSHHELPAGAMERANIQRVLQAPFSLIYAVSRVLIWTNQSSQVWHRPEFPNVDGERVAVVQRVKHAVKDADFARELRHFVDIAESMLSTVQRRDLVLAFHLVGDCYLEAVVRNDGREADEHDFPRDLSFCAHVAARRAPLDVQDTLQSEFRWHPHVVGGTRVRSYFGINVDVLGQTVGSFCAYSSTGFQLNDNERQGLRQITALLNMRLESMILSAS